jgi:hypothetical protein
VMMKDVPQRTPAARVMVLAIATLSEDATGRQTRSPLKRLATRRGEGI